MFSIFLIVLNLFAATPATNITAVELLPADGTPEGWTTGTMQEFPGDALFGHINGGAVQYHDHGFVTLALNDYSNGSLEVRVEIYDMGTVEGATGIFDEINAGYDIGADYGDASTIDNMQIILRIDRFLVMISGYEENNADQIAAMKTLANTICLKVQS